MRTIARLARFIRGLYATPEDHVDPYLWALVLIGHRALGQFTTETLSILHVPLLWAVLIPAVPYGFVWEMGQRRAGGPEGDGLVDTAAFWLGCLSAAAAAWPDPFIHGVSAAGFLILLLWGLAARL